jgi:hypothetical protein
LQGFTSHISHDPRRPFAYEKGALGSFVLSSFGPYLPSAFVKLSTSNRTIEKQDLNGIGRYDASKIQLAREVREREPRGLVNPAFRPIAEATRTGDRSI